MTIKQEVMDIVLANDDEWTIEEMLELFNRSKSNLCRAIAQLREEKVIDVRQGKFKKMFFKRNEQAFNHNIKLTVINNPGASFDALLKLTRTTAPDLYRIMSELNIAPDLKPADCVG